MATKYSKQADGSYVALVWDGTYDAKGNKHRKKIRSTKSSKDLENKVIEFKRSVEDHKAVITSQQDFYEYAQDWVKREKSMTRHNTRRMYDTMLQAHFYKLEGVTVSEISRTHLLTLLAGAPPSSARQIHLIFKQLIKSLVRDRYLPRIALQDIFEDIPTPKVKSTEKKPLTNAERDAIKNTPLEGKYKAYLWLAYGCGLRREEILALASKDITSVVKINKVIVFDNNDPILENDTKSDRSRREVPIPSFAQKFLKAYAKEADGFLFRTEGKELCTKMTYTRMWRQIQKKLNEQVGYDMQLTSHRLRHDYCTSLCYQIPQVSIKTIAKLMGDTEAVVLKVYNHILEEQEDKISAIEAAR